MTLQLNHPSTIDIAFNSTLNLFEQSTLTSISQDNPITRQALGRVAALGELYDARTDNFCERNLFGGNTNRIHDAIDKRLKHDIVEMAMITDEKKTKKMDKLNVEGDLQVSLLGGFVSPLGGSGSYLKDQELSGRHVESSLIYKRITKIEKLNIDHHDAVCNYSPDTVRSTKSATHIVVGIIYGAMATATIKLDYDNEENVDHINTELQVELEKMMIKLGKAGFKYNPESSEEITLKHLAIKFSGDILCENEPLPCNTDEFISFVKRIPEKVSLVDGGKPIAYILLPLTSINERLQITDSESRLVSKLEDYVITQIVQLFEDLDKAKHDLVQLSEYLDKNSSFIPNSVLNNIAENLKQLQEYEQRIRYNVRQIVLEMRQGIDRSADIKQLFEEHYAGNYNSRKIKEMVGHLEKYKEKVNYINRNMAKGVMYITKQRSLNSVLEENGIKKAFIFFCSWDAQNRALHENRQLFETLFNDQVASHIIVDVDLRPEEMTHQNIHGTNQICLWANKQYLKQDLLNNLQNENKCVARSLQERIFVQQKPTQRTILELPCPNSIGERYCPQTTQEWHCYICNQKLEYDFKGNLYCSCGKVAVKAYVFRCSSPNHGNEFTKFDEAALEQLLEKVRSLKETNIIILGESGVGKSTLINAIANLVAFPTFALAQNEKPCCLIPAEFSFTDSENEDRKIRIGDFGNREFIEGASDTQYPASYVFTKGDEKIRFIDTPGICDTKGEEEDKKHCENFLNYIANVDEIHGICLLMRPTQNRLSSYTSYCLKTLLKQLHKNAAENILFCFTHARPMGFHPSASPILKRQLEEIAKERSIEIPLNLHTMYCVDSEIFRYLAAHANGVEYCSGNEISDIEKSWVKSSEEICRLLTHIFSRNPHKTDETITLNEARTIILALSQPLIDISSNISSNIEKVEKSKIQLKNTQQTLSKLKQDLYIPEMVIEITRLPYGRTVCTNNSCNQMVYDNVLNENKILYSSCHDKCEDVPYTLSERVPNPALKRCSVLTWLWFFNTDCKVCGCPWNHHKHITYEQKIVQKNNISPKVYEKVLKTESVAAAKETIIEACNNSIEELQTELQIIIESLAIFSIFLKENSITTYQDTFSACFKHAIKQEATQPGTTQKIKELEKILTEYEKEKQKMLKKMKEEKKITAEDIIQKRKQLFELPKNGETIQKFFTEIIQGSKESFGNTEHFFNRPNLNAENLDGPTNTLYHMFNAI